MTTKLPVRNSDPDTSRSAAAKAVKHRQTVKDAVLVVLRENDAMTHDQLIAAYNVKTLQGALPLASASSIRTRCSELVRDGLVEQVPDAIGRSSMGNRALFWHAVTV